jgi:DNA helicase IV
MRDVLGTIAADQDAIIRAGSRGALVVDGGPGTGKTVVALHRSAYLLYSDPRLGHRRGGVLFVGPHQPYLAYVSDVLPSLGEEGVQTCTLRDLVAEGATAAMETDPDVARLKSSAELVKAIEAAVRFYEKPPANGMTVETPWSDIWLSAKDWTEAFEAPEPGTPHNEARGQIWEELITILTDSRGGDVPADPLRRSLMQNEELRASINYRTPQEVMAEAEPVIRAVLPDANVPVSIRSAGVPVVHGPASDPGSTLDTWLAAHADGIACVIGDPAFEATSRVRSLTPELSKGLEFDLVVLIDPEAFGTGTEGAVDRYVAMTRATQRLVILTSS